MIFNKTPNDIKIDMYRQLLIVVTFIISLWLFLYQFDFLLAISLVVFLTVLDVIFLCNRDIILKTDKKINLLMVPISITIGYNLNLQIHDLFFANLTGLMKIILLFWVIIKCYEICIIIVPWIMYTYSCIKEVKNASLILGTIVSFFFCLWIFIPSSMFFANKTELEVSYWIFIFPLLITFFISVLLVGSLTLAASEKYIPKIGLFFAILLIGSYIQYNFMNVGMGELDGGKYYWNQHLVVTVLSIGVWLIICSLAIISRKYRKDNIMHYVSNFIMGIQMITIIVMIISAPNEDFHTRVSTASGAKQFSLAKEKNTVVFVLDAVDNEFAKQIKDIHPEYYADLKDFTFYTNTCSVYDSTDLSMPQMFAGSNYDYCNVDYVEFYNRLHRNKYEILFFNYDEKNTVLYNIKPFLDNYFAEYAGDSLIAIDYSKIITSSFRFSVISMCPNIMKELFKPETLSFNQLALVNRDLIEKICYENDDFYGSLALSIDDTMNNALIMQHINGAHLPCDDYISETEFCLQIVSEYINQMKVLGVYDDSTIIITADHGVHEGGTVPYPTAATPIFMIKSPGANMVQMNINDSPIYHTDLLATILINAGLYDEKTDYGRFGNSIYDFEGLNRERTWYDRCYNIKSRLCAYTYIGDTDELVRKVENDEYVLVPY